MDTALRERMLARAAEVVNTLASWTHDHPEMDLDAREDAVFAHGQPLLRDLLVLVAEGAGSRRPGPCPSCGVRSLEPTVRPRTRPS